MIYFIEKLLINIWKIFWIKLINLNYYIIRPVYYNNKILNIIVDKPTWLWMTWKILEIKTK